MDLDWVASLPGCSVAARELSLCQHCWAGRTNLGCNASQQSGPTSTQDGQECRTGLGRSREIPTLKGWEAVSGGYVYIFNGRNYRLGFDDRLHNRGITVDHRAWLGVGESMYIVCCTFVLWKYGGGGSGKYEIWPIPVHHSRNPETFELTCGGLRT